MPSMKIIAGDDNLCGKDGGLRAPKAPTMVPSPLVKPKTKKSSVDIHRASSTIVSQTDKKHYTDEVLTGEQEQGRSKRSKTCKGSADTFTLDEENEVRKKFERKGLKADDIDRILFYMKEERQRLQKTPKEEKKNKATNQKQASRQVFLNVAKHEFERGQKEYEMMKQKLEEAKNITLAYEKRKIAVKVKTQAYIDEYNRLRMKNKAAEIQEDDIKKKTMAAKEYFEESKKKYDRLLAEKAPDTKRGEGTKAHQQIQININSAHYNHMEFYAADTTSSSSERPKERQ